MHWGYPANPPITIPRHSLFQRRPNRNSEQEMQTHALRGSFEGSRRSEESAGLHQGLDAQLDTNYERNNADASLHWALDFPERDVIQKLS